MSERSRPWAGLVTTALFIACSWALFGCSEKSASDNPAETASDHLACQLLSCANQALNTSAFAPGIPDIEQIWVAASQATSEDIRAAGQQLLAEKKQNYAEVDRLLYPPCIAHGVTVVPLSHAL